jgi:hypothetical protein
MSAAGETSFVGLASRYAAPAIYMWRDFPPAGGLISYGINPSYS